MARILLGVSGGIAAYKALEFVRLATAAGHVVRVLQTPNSQRFVGAASFAGLTGAPVLIDEFERDPMRGAGVQQGVSQREGHFAGDPVRGQEIEDKAAGDGGHQMRSASDRLKQA